MHRVPPGQPAASAASVELLQTPWAGPADVYVVGPNASPEPGPPGICIAVGMARVGEAEGEVGHMTEVLCERDADPLALRLALMSVSYPQPTDLTAAGLMGARKMLDRWRHRVAEWAEFRQRNPQARMVCLDVQPNQTTQAVEREDILNIGGFSDQVFEVISAFASGQLEADHWIARVDAVAI